MISILDLQVGNVKSLENCLTYIGVKYKKIRSKSDIENAEKIIIPGVGSFDFAMDFLQEKKFIKSLKNFALIQKNLYWVFVLVCKFFFKKAKREKNLV